MIPSPVAFAITARNRMAGLAIESKTTVPDWDGEGMDDSTAAEGLLHSE
ncbi:MAG: hypothetical protein U5R46_15180 [Gammaproteobacteria bacterium]|nr:hypothetical protein [Gammaproteobacteria bacterium]